MAGHSQFKNIMHRKGAQDAKRAKIFTKLIREITVAARMSGPDTLTNPRLRSAISASKQANLPKDRIDAAIKKGAGKTDDSNYFEIRYEGYGPCNVPMIVECLTDNKNRSSSDIKSIFTKYKCNFGPSEFLFNRCGMIVYSKDQVDEEIIFDYAVNEGADDIIKNDEEIKLIVDPSNLYPLAKKLSDRFGDAEFTGIAWNPKEPLSLSEEDMEKVGNFINILEDHDDVQRVWIGLV
jgi:YebC/PmpR family DNA-binding regulatory protein